jgi:hypothetical protein
MTDSALTKQQPEPLAPMQPMEILAEMARRSEDPTVAVAVAKSIVDLQQSSERFAWEREERQAKIDFDNALTICQSKIATLKTNQGRKSRKTALKDDIFWLDYKGLDEAVRPIYLEQGFSIGFSEVQDEKDNYIGMKAIVSRSGVSREYFKRLTLTAAFDGMPKADAETSAASRVKRYLILQIFNVAICIDKDEKKPFENGKQPGELDEREHLTHLENIRNAGNGEELRKMYMKAQTAADATGDTKSTLTFAEAKNKRYRELQSEGRI